MSATIHWLQLGGLPVVNDDNGRCQWPAHPMVPNSCAADYPGYENAGVEFAAVSSGHRGHGTFANSRIIDFRDPKKIVYCRPLCLNDRPKKVCEEEDLCPVFLEDIEGWPNQVGVNDYYCRIRESLKVGDCIATHLVPAREKWDSFTYAVPKCTEGVAGKFKAMCAGVDLTPTIDFSEQMDRFQCVDIKTEFPDLIFGNICDGFEVVLFEIEAMPEDSPAEDCKPAAGKLDDFVLFGSTRTEAICTGK